MTVLASQWFAPTKLVVTFEQDAEGRFTDEQIQEIVQRDPAGKVVGLDLPQRAVLIANHQVGRPTTRLKEVEFTHVRYIVSSRSMQTGGTHGR